VGLVESARWVLLDPLNVGRIGKFTERIVVGSWTSHRHQLWNVRRLLNVLRQGRALESP